MIKPICLISLHNKLKYLCLTFYFLFQFSLNVFGKVIIYIFYTFVLGIICTISDIVCLYGYTRNQDGNKSRGEDTLFLLAGTCSRRNKTGIICAT